MSRQIFHTESGNTESWLIVNNDGSLTYKTENAGWRMARRGFEREEQTMSSEEAKGRWPHYAKIDEVVGKVTTGR